MNKKIENKPRKLNETYYQRLLKDTPRNNKVKEKELNWFKIQNYDYITNLSLRQLITEIVIREKLCTNSDEIGCSGLKYGKTELFNVCYPEILSGKPEINGLFDLHEKIPTLSYLRHTDECSPSVTKLPIRELNIRDIDGCYNALSSASSPRYSLETSVHPCHLGRIPKSHFPSDTTLTTIQNRLFSYGIKQIYLTIDPSYSRSQLIDAFNEMLNNLNENYGIFTKNKQPDNKLRNKTLYDIYAHHIIPLIDLVLWQIHNKKRLSLKMVYNLLKGQQFDASADSTGYSQTNFQSSTLKTFDLIMGQKDPSEILKKLIGETCDYDMSFYEATHK
ncbi:DUF6387 family protein [Morganella morganii]|uniref:DUF6387 family protein n=1 Tax=Morganella morganii TaxID=582 RepID=UPI0018919F0F|nr:DUF6387 family protein [Morganella morganii]